MMDGRVCCVEARVLSIDNLDAKEPDIRLHSRPCLTSQP